MQAYSNKHLVEVLCKFTFIPGSVKWDSGYFGQYFDKIREFGFTERQERKGIRFGFEIKGMNIPDSASNIEEVDSEMLFRDPLRKFAITVANGFISFHIVSEYKDWAKFNSELMEPLMEKYIELNLYEKILDCQVVYLNKFNFKDEEDLSNYFQIVTPPLQHIGKETGVNVSKSYLAPTGIVLSVRILPQPSSVQEMKGVMMECGAVGRLDKGVNIRDWQKMAMDVRNPIRNFFEAIITDKLREIL